jgi:uncharacterized protein YecT (DUF1311 family)
VNELPRFIRHALEAKQTELSTLESRILARLQGDDIARFKASVVAWEAYRDAECKAESGQYEGGPWNQSPA